MDVQINYVGVILAGLSTMLVGGVWYSKAVFGAQWVKLVKLDQRKKELKIKKQDEGKAAGKAMLVTVIISLLTAYVLAHVAYLANSFYGNSFLQDSVTTAFWMWFGFTAARIITHDAFEMRPTKLTVMNVSHELVTFMLMGVVIGLFKP